MMSLLDIGQCIRQERKKQKLSGVQLAQLCSINRSTLVKLENGQGNIELNTLLALCSALKLTIRIEAQDLANIPTAQTPKTKSSLKEFLSQQGVAEKTDYSDIEAAATKQKDSQLEPRPSSRPRLALGKSTSAKNP